MIYLIILKLNKERSERNIVIKEKELSERYGEKVIIISREFDFVYRKESEAEQ